MVLQPAILSTLKLERHNWLNQLFVWLTALLILFIPSNLFLKFAVPSAYVNGLLVDYLLPKFYLSDIVIFVIFGLWLFQFFAKKKSSVQIKYSKSIIFLTALVVLFIGRQFSSFKPLAAFWFAAKLLEMLLLGYFYITHSTLLKQKLI